MAMAGASSNKAKIARRVVEVLDYFDEDHSEATVMDLVRRYNRPQSSTSELLSSLVELGLLHKNSQTRSYSLTPRAALLGSASQSPIVRDGRLMRMIERLAAQTGLAVTLFARVGLRVQLVTIRGGARLPSRFAEDVFGGMQVPLSQSAAGWLLLATVEAQRCAGMVRRLNAEAADASKFDAAELLESIAACRENGHARGPLGFGSGQVLAALLPGQPPQHSLAIGLCFGNDDKISAPGLLACLAEAIGQATGAQSAAARIEHLPNAA